jgi:hypothetical protein
VPQFRVLAASAEDPTAIRQHVMTTAANMRFRDISPPPYSRMSAARSRALLSLGARGDHPQAPTSGAGPRSRRCIVPAT